jgi:hypothetical protein
LVCCVGEINAKKEEYTEMPNHCKNYVRITGSPESIQSVQSKPFSLPEWIPKPEDDSSDWVLENWGTRWIAKYGATEDNWHVELKGVDGGVEAYFESAWAPPIPFYNFLAVRFPDLKIEYEYHEWGIGFCGYGIGANGGDPFHYSYHDKIEELELIRKEYSWHIPIWDPQEEVMKWKKEKN